jgi:hypothetical protein
MTVDNAIPPAEGEGLQVEYEHLRQALAAVSPSLAPKIGSDVPHSYMLHAVEQARRCGLLPSTRSLAERTQPPIRSIGEPVCTRTISEPGIFRNQGDYWQIRFNGKEKLIKHVVGMEYIKRIIEGAGDPVTDDDLQPIGSGALPRSGSSPYARATADQLEEEGLHFNTLGDGSDLTKADGFRYRKGLEQLNAEIKAAEGRKSPVELSDLRWRRDNLRRFISRYFDKSGNPRDRDGVREVRRRTLNKAIVDALQVIRRHLPELADHLLKFLVRQHGLYRYLPDQSTRWKL